jgi:hypothetical protein
MIDEGISSSAEAINSDPQSAKRAADRDFVGAAPTQLPSWAEREARRSHLEVAKRLLKPLAAAWMGSVIGGVAALVLWPTAHVGLLVGVLWTSVVCGSAMIIQQLAGTGPRLMGPTAEGWTTHELRRTQRDGWWFMERLLLEKSDVDHVAVGPAGVFALKRSGARRGGRRVTAASTAQ